MEVCNINNGEMFICEDQLTIYELQQQHRRFPSRWLQQPGQLEGQVNISAVSMPQIPPIRTFLRVRRVQLCKQISYLEMTGHYSYQLTGSPFYERQFLTIGILLLNSSIEFVVSTKLSQSNSEKSCSSIAKQSFPSPFKLSPQQLSLTHISFNAVWRPFFICLNRKAFSMNPFQFEKRAQFRKELTEQCDAAADLIFKGLSSSLLSLLPLSQFSSSIPSLFIAYCLLFLLDGLCAKTLKCMSKPGLPDQKNLQFFEASSSYQLRYLLIPNDLYQDDNYSFRYHTMFAYNFSPAKVSLYGYNPHSKGSAYDQNVSQHISAVMGDA